MEKKTFILILDALLKQNDKDVEHHNILCDIYGASDLRMYDNSSLINLLLKQLQGSFPLREDGECDIERFMYTHNFGRNKNCNIKSAEELWGHLRHCTS